MELESGFIVEPGLDGTESGLILLHRSEKGFAEIWRAEKFGQFVVLKALKPEYRENPVYEALLRKEFDIGYSLNHPSICRSWHFRRHPDLGNCIEMEWIDGLPLSERFAAGKPDEALFRKIAGELCDAVAYLHSRQIIHRDIKPSNILITHNGDNVKLIDFGLADSDDSAILKMQAGTRQYLSPEVVNGGAADIRTDIWAVGRVLGELAGGHRAVLKRACANKPEARFQHIAEFKEALLKPSGRPWIYIVAATVVSAVGIGLALTGPRGDSEPSRPETIVAESVDSAALVQEDTLSPSSEQDAAPHAIQPSPSSGPAQGPAPSSAATREDIDALFREATDLFE